MHLLTEQSTDREMGRDMQQRSPGSGVEPVPPQGIIACVVCARTGGPAGTLRACVFNLSNMVKGAIKWPFYKLLLCFPLKWLFLNPTSLSLSYGIKGIKHTAQSTAVCVSSCSARQSNSTVAVALTIFR